MSDVIQMMTMAIIAFGLTLSFRLLIFRNRVASSVYLSLYVLILAGVASEIFFQNEWQLEVIGASYWAIGPLVYFFVRSKVENTSSLSWHTLYHLVPLAVYVVLVSLDGIAVDFVSADSLDLALYEILFIHILTYFFVSAKVVTRNARVTPRRDIMEKMDYTFSYFLPYASIALFGLPFLLTNLQLLVPAIPMQFFLPLIQLMVLIFILAVAFLNMQHIRTSGQRNT